MSARPPADTVVKIGGVMVIAVVMLGLRVVADDVQHAAPETVATAPQQTHSPIVINAESRTGEEQASGADGSDSTVIDTSGAVPTTIATNMTGDAEPAPDVEPEPEPDAEADAPRPLAPIPVPEGWEVVFRDDFSGPTLAEVWNTCYWWQVDGGCTIASNSEQQWYRPEGVVVEDGELRLTATDDPQRTTDGLDLPFRSGMVTTGPATADDDSSFAFTYGEISVRAILPEGVGTWPAVWLLSADRKSVPEIDILERYGSRPDLVTAHVHGKINGLNLWERVETEVMDAGTTWHTYTVTWSPDRVVFKIDGVETGTITDPRLVPQKPMYFIANLAMGGVAGAVDASALPQVFRIDEIVVSQQVAS